MKRAVFIYAASLLAAAIGVWIIVLIGNRLHAPPSIAGVWSLTPQVTDSAAAGAMPLTLRIDQSGRFVRLAINQAPPQNYSLTFDSVLQLAGETDDWIFTLEAAPAGTARAEHRAAGQRSQVYLATRTGDDAVLATPSLSDQDQEHGEYGGHSILLLIVQLTVIIVASRTFGSLASYIGQPRVVGEMIAGIALGPSLLGWTFPEVSAAIFPEHSIAFLGLLAHLGVIFFLFIIGLELNPQLMRNRGHAAVVVSHVSIVTPFLLGAGLALFLYGLVFNDTERMQFSSVALFTGAAMSVTAFPVLARILTERNLHKTQVGAVAITCAAVDDISAWCLLAFVVGMARAEGVAQGMVTTVLALLYVVAMLFLIRPFLLRVEAYYEGKGKLTPGVLGILVIIVLLSALATEAIGIHALFGAFMAGAIMPKNSRFVREVTDRVEQFTLIVLLPIFFVFTGLQTRIELINTAELWMLTLLIVAVACAGKFGGSTIAAAACGMNWRESAALGILMNTRGLMQLVILEIGRELGVITDAVFAMMVLMALVTTFLTTPILSIVYPDRLIRARPVVTAVARRHDSVLIPISLPRSARALVQIADFITGPSNTARRIIGLHVRRAEEHEAYSAAPGQPAESSEPLQALQGSAESIGMHVEQVSVVSRDAAEDIAQTATDYGAGLILMGFHKPVLGTTILGGTVHRVLEQATVDVAIFVDRGFPDRPSSILVPYLGSEHDRLALEIASTIARHSGAAVTVLHVVPPKDAASERERLNAKAVTERVFTDPSQPSPVKFQVIESPDPIGTVLDHTRPYDLVLIGVAEQWGLTSQLFGWRAERIARDCPTSMLIVRKAPPAPSLSAADRSQNPVQ